MGNSDMYQAKVMVLPVSQRHELNHPVSKKEMKVMKS